MVKSLILAITGLTFAAFGQIILKYAMNQIGRISAISPLIIFDLVSKAALNPMIWLGFGLYGVASFLWLIVLSRENLSFVYPFASLTFIIVILGSAILLKEPISLWHWVGSIVVIIGLFIITRTVG